MTKRNTKKGSSAADLAGAIKHMAAAALATDRSEHELKSWPEHFAAVAAGLKPFEIRRDDRGFLAGDRLRLREWIPTGGGNGVYTGRELALVVTRTSWTEHGLREGHVAMTVQAAPTNGASA